MFFDAPKDAVVGCYSTVKPESSAFGYLRNSDRIVVQTLAEESPGLALLAGVWFELRLKMGIHALSQVLPNMLTEITNVDLLPGELTHSLVAHLQESFASEAPIGGWQALADEAESYKKIRRDIEKQAEKAGKEALCKAWDRAMHPYAGGSGFRPPALEDDKLPHPPRLNWFISRNRGKEKDYRKRYAHRSSQYYIKWTSVEGTQLLLNPMKPPDPVQKYSGDMYPLACNTRHSMFGDTPSLLEMPGGVAQKNGRVLSDHLWADWQWANRVHYWEGPIPAGAVPLHP